MTHEHESDAPSCTGDPVERPVDLAAQYDVFLASVERFHSDSTLSPAARKVAQFLAEGIACKEGLVTVPRLSVLWRGGIYVEWGLTEDDLGLAMIELRDKGYRF